MFNRLCRSTLFAAIIAAGLVDNSFAQTRAQLLEGAKKEGELILSWGTGTMGGIEGAAEMEKAFNKAYKTERSSSHLVKGTQMQQFVAEQEKRGVTFTLIRSPR